jgi:hypothetical protein
LFVVCGCKKNREEAIPISLVGKITTPSLFKNYYENTSLIYGMFIDCANYF